MSAKHLTPALVDRTVHVIDSSGVLDLACPPRQPGQRGRIGNIRDNTRLLLLGMHLCTRLGHEATLSSIHQVLTEALPRDKQWELGVLRPTTTKNRANGKPFDPDAPALVKNGKPRKRIWTEDGVEEISYDDLYNAATALRKRLDYGHGAAPGLDDAERAARQDAVEQIIDALIAATTIPRTGSTWGLDATGQWAWTRGPSKRKKELEKKLADGAADAEDPDGLEVAGIATDDEGATAPEDQSAPAPASARGRCLDAAWGYKTSKTGEKEVGFGFHQHTICRVPDPTADNDDEPLLIDGFVLTPANADVVDASLGLIDRIRARHGFTRLLGDMLYTNLKGGRWAVPLAQRGIEQGLAMRSDNHKVVDINGAQMQHGWLHCAAAPMDQRPLPPDRASAEEWETFHDSVEEFQRNWAFDRKESGLGKNLTSKWICPARAGRAGCHALGAAQVQAATELELPIITPPDDWQTRRCCTGKTMDFTPDPDDVNHQRKLMQREYYGSRRWRRLFKRRALVEGAFGILKNASRQRLRRGQNRLPGLAMASIVAAVKASVFNEEQLRSWHDRTGRGPADHPLLQPDPPYWGFRDLTKEEAKAVDTEHLRRLRGGHLEPVPEAA
ncbi:hypothetical protein [Blastococcus sp. SYSU D00820]